METHQICGHCGKSLGEKTYKEHKRLYYHEGRWIKQKELLPQDESSTTSSLCSEPSMDTQSHASSELHNEDDGTAKIGKHSRIESSSLGEVHDYISDVDTGHESQEPVVELEYWEESDSELQEDFSTDEPQILTELHSDNQCTVTHKSLIWCIMTFVSLFQTLHFIPDRAADWLLQFIGILLKFLGRYSEFIAVVAANIPTSVYMRNKQLFGGGSEFIKYVVCPECHSLYNFKDCLERRGSHYSIKTCSSSTFGKICGTKLLKEVVSRNGNRRFYPYMVYPYASLISSLKKILSRPGFLEICEKNRYTLSQLSDQCSLVDVNDAKIWKDFLSYNGQPFLSEKYTYGFMINVDWFQPFKHRKYSVGVIYVVLMNLPREIRFKRENVIIVGLIPGPKEPPEVINSYLTPLVCELLKLWSGVCLQISDEITIRGALLCVGCDLPAGRKTCGFLSYMANLGCTRCYISFAGEDGGRNFYSPPEQVWPARSNQQHRRDVNTVLNSKNRTEKKRNESAVGCRYSSLLQLPYFDPVRMLVIDPMHNLYLGTAKYLTHEVWPQKGILTKNALSLVEDRIKAVNLPTGIHIGRLPANVGSGVTLTAEQWLNWVNYFSIFCLFGILPSDQMECWRHFVLASRTLCKPSLSATDITLASALLRQFCKRFAEIYGPELVTPNIHLHTHLADCIRDYGPVHSFWLFSFERYNGILSNEPSNNRSIEVQLMNRFIRDTSCHELLRSYCTRDDDVSQFFSGVIHEYARTHFMSTGPTKKFPNLFGHKKPMFTARELEFIPSPKHTIGVFSAAHHTTLRAIYSKMFPTLTELTEGITLPKTYHKMDSIHAHGVHLSANEYVLAQNLFPFESDTSDPLNVSHSLSSLRPAKVHFYLVHCFYISSKQYINVLAAVSWPCVHPSRNSIGKPVQVWCSSVFECNTLNGFVPVENIKGPLITAQYELCTEQVLIVIPFVL